MATNFWHDLEKLIFDRKKIRAWLVIAFEGKWKNRARRERDEKQVDGKEGSLGIQERDGRLRNRGFTKAAKKRDKRDDS